MVIAGSFGELKRPESDFFLPVRYNRWLVKNMCKSRLLLNDMPVFNENRFKISVAVLLVVTGAIIGDGVQVI